MYNFYLVKSTQEIIDALNGNGYVVRLDQCYSKAPSVNRMNRDGLRLSYINTKYPNKKFNLWVENEYVIDDSDIMSARLIKYMIKTYGDAYMKNVKIYLDDVVSKSYNGTSSTWKEQRLKEEMEMYKKLQAEVKAELAKEKAALNEKAKRELKDENLTQTPKNTTSNQESE